MTSLHRGGWAIFTQGMIGILMGILALIWPGLTLRLLVMLFSTYALIGGILALYWASVASQGVQDRWVPLMLEGLTGIGAAVVGYAAPGFTALALLFLVAAWSIVTGVLQIIAAIRLRQEVEGEAFLAFAGVISVLFGVLLIFRPGAGLLTLAWLVGFYLIVLGASHAMLGMRLRALRRAAET